MKSFVFRILHLILVGINVSFVSGQSEIFIKRVNQNVFVSSDYQTFAFDEDTVSNKIYSQYTGFSGKILGKRNAYEMAYRARISQNYNSVHLIGLHLSTGMLIGKYIKNNQLYLSYAFRKSLYQNWQLTFATEMGVHNAQEGSIYTGEISRFAIDGKIAMSLQGKKMIFGFVIDQLFNNEIRYLETTTLLRRNYQFFVKYNLRLSYMWDVNFIGRGLYVYNDTENNNGFQVGSEFLYSKSVGIGFVYSSLYGGSVTFNLPMIKLRERSLGFQVALNPWVNSGFVANTMPFELNLILRL